MATIVKAWSFTNHILMINDVVIENFGEGDDVLSTEYREDGITDTVGADGNMQPSISANESALIKIKLLAGAPSNDYLENLYQQFLRGEIDGISVSIFNSFTGKGQVSTTGYIPRLANESRGAKASDREWSVVVPKLDIQKATK